MVRNRKTKPKSPGHKMKKSLGKRAFIIDLSPPVNQNKFVQRKRVWEQELNHGKNLESGLAAKIRFKEQFFWSDVFSNKKNLKGCARRSSGVEPQVLQGGFEI